MNNRYITAILSFLLLIPVTSCSVLDKPPLDKIENSVYWKTSSDLETYIIQFYPQFNFAASTGPFEVDGDNGSDDVINTIVPNPILHGSRAVTNSGGNWTWTDISSINTFFDNCNSCEEDIAQWKHNLGEAHFFRAWLYFKKVVAFGDVPIYTTALGMDSEDLYKPRDKRTDVVDFILDDLDLAIDNLDQLSDVNEGSNRLSKEAALLFKSRVALFEGTWQKYHKQQNTKFYTDGADATKYLRAAADAAEELIDGAYTKGIYGSSSKEYGEMFRMDDMSGNPEVILWKDFDQALNITNNLQLYTTIRTSDRSATLEFVQSFLSKEGKVIDYYAEAKKHGGVEFLTYLKDTVDPRLAETIYIPGDYLWNNSRGVSVFEKPFLGKTTEFNNFTGFQLCKGANPESDAAGGTFGDVSETGFIVFRYAEALLNYAEAKCELGETVDYNKSLNLLRARVGMPMFDKTLSDPNFARYDDYGYSISNELREIRRERRVELGQEGYRYLDYRRWAAHKLFQGKRPLGFKFIQSEYPDVNMPLNEDGFMDPLQNSASAGYKFNEGRDYLECVPTNEITINENLTQNPGW